MAEVTKLLRNSQYSPGQQVVPGYTLIELLGAGMAGDVWKSQAAGGKQVAIKIIPLHEIGGRKELKALKTIRNIRHPNLCEIHGFWTKDASGRVLEDGETEATIPDSGEMDFRADAPIPMTGTMAVTANQASPRISGKHPMADELIVAMGLGDCTLSDYLRQVRRSVGIPETSTNESYGLDPDETIRFLRAAAKAIDKLNQEHGIYHCDVKPMNILLVGGEAQVCDFGLARKFDFAVDPRMSQGGFATPAYAAPEILKDQKYSPTVDVYSLAMTYFEMRTGLFPFDCTSAITMSLAKEKEEFELSQITPPERKILQKALSVDPANRYGSCKEFIDAIAIATGVDRRGGVTLTRLAVTATLLLALGGGILAAWHQFSPESFPNFFPGEATAEQLNAAEVAGRWKGEKKRLSDFKEKESAEYPSEYKPVRDWIETTQDPDLDGEKMPDDVRELATEATAKLAEGILNQLRASKLTDRAQNPISIDLDQLESVYAKKQDPFLDLSRTDAAKLRFSVNLARVQLAIRKGELTSKESVQTVRELLNAKPPAFGEKRQLAATVTLALTHDVDSPTDHYFIERARLSDIAVAQRMIDDQGPETLPIWCQSQWEKMRRQFIPQLEEANKNKSDRETRSTIVETWPWIEVEAKLMEVEQSVLDKEWDALEPSLAELRELMDDISVRDANQLGIQSQKQQIFEQIKKGLDDVRNAESVLKKISKILPNADSSSSFRVSIDSWLAEIFHRSCELTPRLTVDQAKSLRRQAEALSTNLPPAADAILMSATITNKRDELKEDEIRGVVKSNFESLTGFQTEPSINGQLAAAITLELATLDKEGLSPSDLDAIEKALSGEGITAPLPACFPKLYLPYCVGLVKWHKKDYSEAADDWNDLGQSADKSSASQQLGPDRCESIAEKLLGLATVESGVPDSEVLQQRFVDSSSGQVRISQAKTWMDLTENPSLGLLRRYNIQKLLSDLAARLDNDATTGTNDALDDVLRLLPNDDNPWDKIDDGQLYQAAFAISLAHCQLNMEADRSEKVKPIGFMLRSAVAILNIGLTNPNIIDKPVWIGTVLAPTMEVVRPLAYRLDQSKIGWTIEVRMDLAMLRRFCKRYLQTERFDSEEKEEDRLYALELSAAVLAADLAADPATRVKRWLQAAEFYEAQQYLPGLNSAWSQDKLDVLAGYLLHAKHLDSENPELALRIAFWQFRKSTLTAGKDKVNELSNASKGIETAIMHLKKVGGHPTALYIAYWRHANILVNLAFEQHQVLAKKKTLETADAYATRACELLLDARIRRHVNQNRAYLVRGNIREDLARYCYPRQSKEQKNSYQSAMEAFETVLSDRRSRNRMSSRFALARCKFRFAMDVGPRVKYLTEAKKTLGQDDQRAFPQTRAEWLVWSSRINFELDNREQAFDDAKSAYGLVHEFPQAFSNQPHREQIILLHVKMLRSKYGKKSNEKDKRIAADNLDLAIDILTRNLRSPSSSNYWRGKVLECDLLNLRNRHTEIVQLAENMPLKEIADGLERFPQVLTSSLVKVALYVRKAGFPEYLGMDPKVKTRRAADCLARIRQEIETDRRIVDRDPASKVYVDLFNAIAESLSSRSLAEKVKAYLRVLPKNNPPSLDREVLDQTRHCLREQFEQSYYANATHGLEAKRMTESAEQELSQNEDLILQLALLRERAVTADLEKKERDAQLEFLDKLKDWYGKPQG